MTQGLVSCRDAVIASAERLVKYRAYAKGAKGYPATVEKYEGRAESILCELDTALEDYVRAYNLERVERALKIPIGTKHL